MLLVVIGCYGSKIMQRIKFNDIGREIKIPLVSKDNLNGRKVSLCFQVLLNSIRSLTQNKPTLYVNYTANSQGAESSLIVLPYSLFKLACKFGLHL